MLYAVIIGCEISFWLFLLAGLAARYLLRQRQLSTLLLICAPLVDLVLLITSVIDLRSGAVPTVAHGLAAVYIGISVAWGPQMIRWADSHFAHRFANGEPPIKPPKFGAAKARYERQQWLRHLLAWTIGISLMALASLLVGDFGQARPFRPMAELWTIVLAIDGMFSFSYTLFPRREKTEGI